MEEFAEQVVELPHGESVCMPLAERGPRLGKDVWVREIRKLTETGHQVSILSTNFEAGMTSLAAHMFARWPQENLFQCMMQPFAIDRLVDYQTGSADETAQVVNPARISHHEFTQVSARVGTRHAGVRALRLADHTLSDCDVARTLVFAASPLMATLG